MIYLVEHLPPPIRLVIASRADPAWPLARLRARANSSRSGPRSALHARRGLGFYLHEVMGLELTTADVAALEGRTEGWIAALQLAALSMQGRADVAGFIAGFVGDDRYRSSPAKPAMKPATSARPCIDSAASWSVAIHPSVRPSRAATSAVVSSSPITSWNRTRPRRA